MADPWNQGPQTSTVRATREVSEVGKLCLLIIGDGIHATYLLPGSGTVLIGRQPGCDVVIDHLSISRRHAQLRMGPAMSIEDLGSANGTRVRGEWIRPGVPAPFGASDALDIGSMIAIVQHRSQPLRAWRLWSHGYFEARLGEECTRAERTGESFVLAQLHCAAVPPAIVEDTLADVLRPTDIVGSYAPGEYEVLMTEISSVQAEHIVARVVSALGQRAARCRVGVACYPQDGRAPDSLLAAARGVAIGGPRVEGATGNLIVTEGAMQQLHRVVERVAAGTPRSESPPPPPAPVPPPPAPAPPPDRAEPSAPPGLPHETVADIRREMDALERDRILRVLSACGSNQTEAARVLGLSRRALVNRLDAWGVARPRKRLKP